MEAELAAFRAPEEEEVAEQLERQVAKREEIMRNKALLSSSKRKGRFRLKLKHNSRLNVQRFVIV